MADNAPQSLDTVEALAELLEAVAAALNTCLAVYGNSMPMADQLSRRKLVSDAKAMVTIHGAKQPFTVVLLDEDLQWRDPVMVVARDRDAAIAAAGRLRQYDTTVKTYHAVVVDGHLGSDQIHME